MLSFSPVAFDIFGRVLGREEAIEEMKKFDEKCGWYIRSVPYFSFYIFE